MSRPDLGYIRGIITPTEYELSEGGHISGRATVRNVLLRSGGYPPLLPDIEPTVEMPRIVPAIAPALRQQTRPAPVTRAPMRRHETRLPTGWDVVIVAACLLGAAAFGALLAAGFVALAEQMARGGV